MYYSAYSCFRVLVEDTDMQDIDRDLTTRIIRDDFIMRVDEKYNVK